MYKTHQSCPLGVGNSLSGCFQFLLLSCRSEILLSVRELFNPVSLRWQGDWRMALVHLWDCVFLVVVVEVYVIFSDYLSNRCVRSSQRVCVHHLLLHCCESLKGCRQYLSSFAISYVHWWLLWGSLWLQQVAVFLLNNSEIRTKY